MTKKRSSTIHIQSSFFQRWLKWLIPLFILIVAAFLRLYRLNEVPPAFNFDEAAHAIDALDILGGHHFLFSPKLQGVVSFYMYCTAGAFRLLGATPYAQRLVSAVIGTATVLTVYFMVLEIFYEAGKRKRILLAALTSLGLAISLWHIIYSRIGLEVIMTPFFTSLSFYFLWRGLRTNNTTSYIWSGIWMGINAYSHQPARLMPIPVVLFFFIRWWVLSHNSDEKEAAKWQNFWASIRPLFIIGITALLVYTPMLIYFSLNPQDLIGRSAITSVFNPNINQGDFWGTLWRSALGTFGAFGFTHDINWLANLPGRSILNPVMAALFWTGVLLTIFRIRRLPYLFLFLAWTTLLLPAIVTPDRTPHYSRMMISSSVAFIFPAIALAFLSNILEALLGLGRLLWYNFSADGLRYSVGYPEETSTGRTTAIWLVRFVTCLAVAILFGLTGISTYRDYFNVWAKSDAHYMSFDGYAVELVQHMESNPNPRAVYVIPRDIRAGDFYQHYTIDFLHREGPPHVYLPMNEPQVPQQLSEAALGKDTVYLVSWKMDKHREADPKQYASWLLERFGQFEETETYPAYDLLIYSLPSQSVDFTIPAEFTPVEASFGGKISLNQAGYGNASARWLDNANQAPSGGLIWLRLEWEKTTPFEENYRASIILQDENGHIITHKDRDLIHTWHMRTSGWPQGEDVPDYYLLPVPAGTPPGTYQLHVAVYSAQTMERLPLDGKGVSTAPIGPIRILAPEQPRWQGLKEPEYEREHFLADDLYLRGFDLDLTTPYYPGQKATIALYWQAAKPLEKDYEISLWLAGDNSDTGLIPAGRPLGDAYPTNDWLPEQIWRALYDFRVPSRLDSGEYELWIALNETGTTTQITRMKLGQVQIEGRARQFDIPPISEPAFVNLGDEIRFLGYDLKQNVLKPGDSLHLTLYWQALDSIDTSYKVFVHLLDSDNIVRAQRDYLPVDGQAPTTGWITDEIITDKVTIPLGIDIAPGAYSLEIGMYDPVSGTRLSTVGNNGVSDNRILLERVIIEP